ncbi:MAG: ABC transporter ATP-binding protein [Myxococcota bacterium]|nr:ABC transporter ATP-binding protein [Myxococcota bacterium]
MTDPLAVLLENIGHSYGADPILRDINLRVSPGEFVAIMGASGAGKSSILRAIAGLIQPQIGRLHIAGQCVLEEGRSHVPTERRGVGMMFQDFALFPHMTVGENVMFGIHRSAGRTARRDELLHLVNLSDMVDRYPGSLSGGQQQRVALARALAPRPKLLLLDEPFANLDAALKADLASEIRRILKGAGAAALLVSHDREECLGLSDKVAILGQLPGQGGFTIVQEGHPREVYRHPRTRTAAQLTGPVIFLDGHATKKQASTAMGLIPLESEHTGPVCLAVRPHQLSFKPTPDGASTLLETRYLAPGSWMLVESPIGTVGVPWALDALPVGTRGQLTLNAMPAVLDSI